VGGYDYVSDFLIAPADKANQTRSGDSGTIWHLPPDKQHPLPRPLCIEWGGQVFLDGASQGQFQFALATSLSNVCKLLDVELVQAHNTGVQPYWGQMGHYSIGAFACDAILTKLRAFLKSSIDRISFEIGHLAPKDISKALRRRVRPRASCHLLTCRTSSGRRCRRSRAARHPPAAPDVRPDPSIRHIRRHRQPGEDGKTLLRLCLDDPDNIDVDVWRAFYDAAGRPRSRARLLRRFGSAILRRDGGCRAPRTSTATSARRDCWRTTSATPPAARRSMLADGYSDRPPP
jgi:hypothetical protein